MKNLNIVSIKAKLVAAFAILVLLASVATRVVAVFTSGTVLEEEAEKSLALLASDAPRSLSEE